MVLESVVADLLNRFLGDYVENLNKSQLKLGIWGGNVALDNLQIKENSLSELDVPFKVKAGQIDKLTLKIPWKNLYGEAVIATLEGLYLLVVPGASIKYDAEKEEKALQDIKQKELSRVEEAIQKAAEKGTHSGEFIYGLENFVYKDIKPGRKRKKHKKHFKKPFKGLDRSKDKPKEAKKDTFLEKLATQVIKNVQVKITDIHIKYEDDVTDPKRPLSFGVTMGELSLLTANEHWTPCILNEAEKIIYKLIRLDSLSAYWNVNCSMSYQRSREQILDQLKSEILTSSNRRPNHQYIFQPISASAKLYMNPYAETELKTPKLDWNIEVQNIAIELTKPQYLSMIDLLESVDYMVRNIPYRKYKPYLPLHDNCRQWWKYAIDSVLEVHIRRYTQMWSWNNIKKHRQLLKSYKNAYKSKLTQTKVSEEVQKQIQDLEKSLDVFNIILARQQTQVEVIRSGQKLRKKSTDTGEKRGGWFSGFWGKKESKKKDEESLIPETIDDLMTPEEKAKLFTAIGYSESTHNLTLPKQYVAHIMTLKLLSTSVTIREKENVPEILKIQIIGLGTQVSQRPGAQALRVEAKLEHWYITGLRQQNIIPSLVASIGDTASSLLKIEFETNPENSPADQTLVVQSQPVEVIYDAKTINAVVEFFQSNKGLDLEQITSATLMKLEEIKERTATGLTHIIETRKVLDLRINLKPSYLIVPQTGFYHENSTLLILDFGTFQLNSKDLGLQQTASSSLEEIMDKAYDKFDVEIKSVQLLFARAEENWKKCRFQHPSSLHVLQPMDIHIELAKAMVEKDIRMARFKVSGGLPLMHVRISDQKMKDVLCLINSISLPQKSPTHSPDRQVASIPVISDGTKCLLGTPLLLDGVESESDDEYFDAEDGDSQTGKSIKRSEVKKGSETPNEELINLLLKFEIKEVVLELTKQQKEEDRILVFSVTQLGTEATVRTFDLTAVSYLKKISLDYHEIPGSKKKPLHLISSSDKPGLDLLKVEYIKADKNGPSFQTTFENTEQTVKVAFSSLNLLLQTQALLSSINYLTNIIPSDGQNMGDVKEAQISTEKQQKSSNLRKVIAPIKDSDITDFRLFAKLNAFCVIVCNEKNNIAEIKIQGLDSFLSLQSRKQSLFARLENIIVTDVDPKTVHKKAVSIMGNEVFRFSLDLYPGATEGDSYTDMSKVDGVVSLNVGCIQIVYLHKFLMSLLNFLNNFQTAKEALSAATAQAAEKAATSVKDLAQRSFRVSINIDLKAPVIIIPQSSISTNAVLVDLGLIKVQNQFSLVSGEDCLHPPVIDRMDVQLTKLKLSRTVIQPGISHPDIQLLYPINLDFSVNRNLASSWYHKVPVVEIKGHLDSMNVSLNQEDLNLLFKILVENLGETSEDLDKMKPKIQETDERLTVGEIKDLEISTIQLNAHASQDTLTAGVEEIRSVDIITMLLNFEIREVMVTLMKKGEKKGKPVHELNVLQLGMEARVKTYDTTAKAFLKKITMRCFDFTDSKGEPLHIINSSNVTDEPLLKMLLTKADSDGPEFKTIHDNTKQRMKVSFSSLDLVLHLEALLSLMDFLSSAVPSSEPSPSEKESELKLPVGESRSIALKAVSSNISQGDVFDLKVIAELNAFNIFVCDQKCNIADIRIQGMDASVSMKSKQTDVFARLKDIVVTNVDLLSIHKKAVSILGDEVFRFQMTFYPDTTEGEAYADMSKVDGKLSLKVGCIQIVYVHKFFMSLLNFLNNFQTAKEALSAATVQAAEKAASSMKDLAQKSFRLLMDINLKAPVIIVPQSSVSPNAVIADLGLIRIENKFSLVPVEHSSLPPVIDKMNIQLTHLKLSRTILQADLAKHEIEILKPVNMLLSIQRNLAAAWYVQIPGMEIKGKLKPMQVALSEHDLTVLMKILLENLGEASSQPSPIQSTQEALRVRKEDVPSGSDLLKEQEDVTNSKILVDHSATLQFDFHFESLSIVLYNNDINQESRLSFHNDSLRLGELRLHLMASAGKMFKDGSMNVNIKLKTCTLDDLREGTERATSRMIDKKNDQNNHSSMIDINYEQDKNGSQIDAVLDKLYVCASVEFLMTVADFFIKAVPQSPENMAKEAQISLRQTGTARIKSEKDDSVRPNMTLKAVIIDPEVVFVANLTKADAPAVTASFQCNLSLSTSKLEQMMEASVRDLKVLACPFLREKRGKNITTVLQPCSLFMEKCTWASGKQNINITLKECIIKISPIILNTVMTIMAAMSPKAKEDESKDTSKEMENLWGIRSVNDYNSWFLGVDTATEVTENFTDIEHLLIEENCAIVVESVQVTLECGLGHRTVPLLLAESKFSGIIKNWTSLMAATADMTLEVHYYNETHAAWEPLIERVEGKKQWNLRLDVKKNPVQDKSLVPGDDFIFLPDPQMAIYISSGDTMNITISKSCLNVFSNLAKGFSEGTTSTFDYSLKDRAPFTVKNAIGIPINVRPSHNLRVMGSPERSDIYDVDAGQNLELEYASMEPLRQGKLSILSRQESSFFTLTFVPHGYTEVANIPVVRPGRRLYNVRNPTASFSDSVLVQIDATEGNKVITLRSPLQIKNHFSIAFIIYKFVKNVKLLERIGVARPEEEFHVPLDSYRCQLFIQPAGLLEHQYKMSTTYISWKEELHRSREVRCMLQCPSTEVNFLPLIVNTAAVPDELNYICSHGEDWDPAYIIHLYPPLTLRNLLPYSFRYLLEGTAETHKLAEGSAADVLHSRIGGEIMELVLMKYQGKNWNGHFRISDTLPEFFLVCFTSDSSEVMTLDLSVHVRRIGSRMVLSVFSPYWLINKTSRVLQYRAEDIHVKHPADFRDIILFSFKKKNIFSKNKVQLKISTSTWSSSFSLDTVGSYGCVKCPANNMEYLVGVSIKMSSFNLSRIVTLTPFCTIANKSSLELEVGEIAPDGSIPTNKWNYIASSECLPFWPENLSGKLCVRVVGCEGSSKPFFYNRQDNGTLLSLEDMNGGILVDVNTAEHSTVITFSDYHEGSAPALIINHTPWDILTYKQSGSQEEMVLLQNQVRLFAWEDPTTTRKLTWKYAANVGENDLLKDECGQFPYDANIQIHWVSFLDGRQRVLLFTDDVALVSKARQAEEMEQADHEICLSLHSLGLSLVNNDNKQEVSYIGITSSGVVWEMKPKQKWKPFSQKQIILLEQAYQKYQVSGDHGWIKLDNNFEVNFDKVPMEMRFPIRCPIKRDFLSGIQIELKQSPHQRSLRARLYWLQVDNQLPGTMFPVVFHPVAPPKSIALDSEPKPFIDVSVITRFNEYSKVLQFKYFMVLIQEMALKVDQGFLGAIVALFTPTTDPEAENNRTKLIQQDIDALNTELMETSMTDMSVLSFFEHFHISPIKLHLSLSLGSGSEESDKEKQEMIAILSVNLLLKSIGATLTDVDDLIFKLAYYEIRYQFYKRDQLIWSVIRHYSEQFLKQMYVLVLGLDVLGNPFGLIRGLSEGVEALFYEPFQGYVHVPEEFAEGLVIGVRSLFGHTVGGAAGVVSRITGSVGKGLAAITMDKEYQQKRREEMGRQPKDFGDSLARGGKGFLRGVVGGVTGIITKPVEGAKKEGAAGFFKGIGKGLVGVVARPTGGIIDMASSTFQGIQRAAESTEEVSRLRPPRLIHEDGIIRPYDRQESEGYDLFESHVKKLEEETYRYHCAIPGNKKTVFMVTNRRVLCIKEVEILGHMSIDWQCPFEDFVFPPSATENLLTLSVKDQSLFHKKDSAKQGYLRKIYLQDAATAKRAYNAIEDAQSMRHQQKLVKQSSLKLLRLQLPS
ncbi:vacuolar protein sorting-associated protein 13C [Orycteropus afer afer]|uniref:Vacuolar protein sorting-associated protein 13C n=1 Tax=Orycteropus afer afer TaxID=1230840 RepID=A0A8B7B8F5_ORYAF|nr:vacuolar protein sorting-associated protein 13C [Orycteropus afer afer]